jgi:hypothetical protein
LGVERAAELGREPGQHFGPARVDAPIQDDLMKLVLGAVGLGLAATELLRLADLPGLGRQDGEPLDGLSVSRGFPGQDREFPLFDRGLAAPRRQPGP